jgi:hypothetical protein
MPFWLIIPIIAGVVAAGVFWDHIREWFTERIRQWEGRWLGAVLRKGFVEIDKLVVPMRRVVKRAIAFFQKANRYYKETTEEEITMDDLPADVREAVRRDEKIVLEMQEQ